MAQFLAFLFFGSLTMTSLASAEISHADCVQTGADRYRITFQLDHGSNSVEVISSLQPDGSNGHVVGTARQSPYEATVAAGTERVYFFLKPDRGPVLEVSLRRLPLAGAANFRDLGGYRSADGRQVAWGKIYRSGELGHLTDSDLRYLSSLHIRVACDFRTRQEGLRLPDKLPQDASGQAAIPLLTEPIGDEPGNESQKLIHEALAHNTEPENLRLLMASAYERIALDGAPRYRVALREIAEGKLPFAYHCTAGKDRTGLFSAILLTILGVPRDAIREDYLLSNEYLLTPAALAEISAALHLAAPGAPPPDPESVRILASVDERYLDAAFTAIDRRYGSFDAYRREALGLSDQDVEAVRRALLNP